MKIFVFPYHRGGITQHHQRAFCRRYKNEIYFPKKLFLKILQISVDYEEDNIMYSICTYMAENDDALNLVEGEKVYVIGEYSVGQVFN